MNGIIKLFLLLLILSLVLWFVSLLSSLFNKRTYSRYIYQIGGENPGGENPGGENPGGENPGGENPGGENPEADQRSQVTTVVTPIPAPPTTARPNVPAICPSGYNLENNTCVRPLRTHPITMTVGTCPAGYTNTGLMCTRPAEVQISPSVLATCPPGYSNNGFACQNDADTYVKGCSVPGATIYPCREGFTDMGCYCQLTSGVRSQPLDMATCPSQNNSFVNYIRMGNRCYPICPLNYVRQGEECVRPESSLDTQYMTCPPDTFRQNGNCYQTCEPGFVLKNGVCESPIDIKGPEVMKCPPTHPELIGTNCYGSCPVGSQPLGTSCITRI